MSIKSNETFTFHVKMKNCEVGPIFYYLISNLSWPKLAGYLIFSIQTCLLKKRWNRQGLLYFWSFCHSMYETLIPFCCEFGTTFEVLIIRVHRISLSSITRVKITGYSSYFTSYWITRDFHKRQIYNRT